MVAKFFRKHSVISDNLQANLGTHPVSFECVPTRNDHRLHSVKT
jgi:hypothetical protein